MARTVIVTGSSSGIGLATAVAFARKGDTVVATMRDTSRGGGLRDAAREAGVEVEVEALEITDDASVERLVRAVVARHGGIDVVVNNAGTGYNGSLEELTIDDLRRSLDVNFLGAARVTRAVLPIMRAAGHGHLIAVSSFGGAFGQPFNDAYCAAKFALEGLYESLAPVAATFGVRVSLVEPGPVQGGFRDRSAGVAPADRVEPYLTLWNRSRTVTDAGFARAQAPDGVAAVIVGVADDPAARLRYQTNSFGERMVGLKLADRTGDAIVQLTSAWLQEAPPAPA